jgi:uncharacterized protein involved in exopolysaccharide biosynthesis
MNTAERAAVRARAVELIQRPKPRRLHIAALAFLLGVAFGVAAAM